MGAAHAPNDTRVPPSTVTNGSVEKETPVAGPSIAPLMVTNSPGAMAPPTPLPLLVRDVMTTGELPAAPTVIENACGGEALPEAVSVAVMPKLYVPPAGIPGVPPIVPAARSSVSTGGSAPEDTAHCRAAGFPPTAEMVAIYGAPAVPPGSVAGATYGCVCPLISETSNMELSTTSRSLTWNFLMHARSLSSQRTSGTPWMYPALP